MTVESKTTLDHVYTPGIQAPERRILSSAVKVGRFILHFLEMGVTMMVGMIALYLLEEQVPASSRYAVLFEYGTNPYDLAMGVFMTVPMVTWMIVRKHGVRHSVEMAAAMLAPVAVIIALRLLGVGDGLPWLDDASHPAMFLAMLVAMLFRRSHYTGGSGHAGHAGHAAH